VGPFENALRRVFFRGSALRVGARVLQVVTRGSDAVDNARSIEFPVNINASRGFVRRGCKETLMLKWAIIFAIIAVIAGLFGFTGIAAGAAGIAKILFVVFLVLFVAVLLFALLGAKAVSDK
jgi:uncharacterized membrane protein YtjA (UPF0391 family)